MEIKWSASPNYREGRKGYIPIIIVDHITAGSYPGCLSWMQNPDSEGSAHFLVTKKGLVFQLVDENNTAWANGYIEGATVDLDLVYQGINPNLYSLSIEHEGQPGDVMLEEQYQATLWLHKYLIKKWNIQIDNNHIIGHYRLDSVDRPNCPGSGFPWEKLFNDLEEINTAKLIDVHPDWYQLGVNALQNLKARGILTNPEYHIDVLKEADENSQNWLNFVIEDRICEKLGIKKGE
jgi:N-acetyl-anhydromuramyl-L-alanine amidase AmpD